MLWYGMRYALLLVMVMKRGIPFAFLIILYLPTFLSIYLDCFFFIITTIFLVEVFEPLAPVCGLGECD